jgi:hypothetical protein
LKGTYEFGSQPGIPFDITTPEQSYTLREFPKRETGMWLMCPLCMAITGTRLLYPRFLRHEESPSQARVLMQTALGAALTPIRIFLGHRGAICLRFRCRDDAVEQNSLKAVAALWNRHPSRPEACCLLQKPETANSSLMTFSLMELVVTNSFGSKYFD